MSAMLDVSDARVWTAELLDVFLSQGQSVDLDWRRFEIVDGLLVVSPLPVPRHERIVMTLGALLIPAVPAGYQVIGAARIEIARSYRVTDVTVLADRVFGSESASIDPQNVLVAVEIESSSSMTTDRITKAAQYAAAGIEHYWRVETAPLRLVTYRLVDGHYAEVGSWSATEVATIEHPFTVSIDLGSLRSDMDGPDLRPPEWARVLINPGRGHVWQFAH